MHSFASLWVAGMAKSANATKGMQTLAKVGTGVGWGLFGIASAATLIVNFTDPNLSFAQAAVFSGVDIGVAYAFFLLAATGPVGAVIAVVGWVGYELGLKEPTRDFFRWLGLK